MKLMEVKEMRYMYSQKRRGLFSTLFSVMLMTLFLVSSASAQDVFTGNPIANIAEQSSPAVVNIDVETLVTRSLSPFPDDPFFKQFFGEEFKRFNRTIPMKGRGSGFIVSDDGQIITNNHVVEDADKITVTLSDGRTFDAEVLGKDPTFDLAVIKIEASDLPTLKLGDSDKLKVGEWVVAIGNPFGLEHTVTAGVLSAKNRSIHAGQVNFDGFLQTDAAINPGNSGGPLLNLEGEVVGINSAIIPYAQGIGFAIPVNMAKEVVDDLIEFGKVNRGWLGVYIQPISEEFANAYGLKSKDGAVVSDVVPGSPAEKSGIHRGDVLVELNGEKIEKPSQFVSMVRQSMAGEEVKIGLIRQGKKMEMSVLLGEVESAACDLGTSGCRTIRRIGIEISDITDELKEEFKLSEKEGVVITKIEESSIASRMGLKVGDVILEVNGTKMSSTGKWDNVMKKDIKALAMLISRDGRTFFVSMSLK
jgi:serine protease Do